MGPATQAGGLLPPPVQQVSVQVLIFSRYQLIFELGSSNSINLRICSKWCSAHSAVYYTFHHHRY